MKVAWKVLDKNISRRWWMANIGTCSLSLRVVDPLYDNSLWKERNVDGEELFKYEIKHHDYTTSPTTSRVLESGTMSIPRAKYFRPDNAAKDQLVELARQHPECKRTYHTRSRPSSDLIDRLTEIITNTITRVCGEWRHSMSYWETTQEHRQGYPCPFPRPAITPAWLLVAISAYTIDDSWWNVYKKRHREVVQSILSRLVRDNILTTYLAWDDETKREVRAYEPKGS